MNHISFAWSELTPLATELIKPLKEVSLGIDLHGKPQSMTLWRLDGTGLRVHSEMHDVAERREVGVLDFRYVLAPSEQETIVDLESTFDRELTVSKLIIHESNTSAESGVILKSAAGHEILIVAGAFPCCLAIRGLFSTQHIFDPEYPLDLYSIVPISVAPSSAARP